VAHAAHGIEDSELSDTRLTQRAYWTGLQAVLTAGGGPVSGNRKPQAQSWMAYPIGRSGFSLSAVMIRPKNQIRAELYISGGQAKGFFASLRSEREEIERELGYPLEWEEMRQDCRVATYLHDVDPENEDDWPRQHQWLATHLSDLHRVLSSRVKALEPTLPPESD